jgi:PKD repeat protein
VTGVQTCALPISNWDANNLNDFTFSWPREKYLNIYVVKTLNINATAYAFLPGTLIGPNADVIVTIHSMVGSIGTGTVANSRVLTHEVGHWFGLQHIWGTSNTPGVVCGDDLVSDTPITKGFATCATSNTGICNPGIVENVQNYMDYSPCKIMFTNGQADRMRGVITGTLNQRNNIYSPANLAATGLTSGPISCLPTVDFKSTTKKLCSQKPITFTSLTQNGEGTVSRLWTFEGGTPASSTDSNVVVTYELPGNYAVSLQITNGFGSTTETRTSYVQVGDGNAGSTLPFSFTFENDTLIPTLAIENPDQNLTRWEQNTSAGAAGSGKSFFINSFYDESLIRGEKDAVELPPLNFTGLDQISLSFSYAYARLSTSQRDSLKVQYSLDCGGNWTSIGGLPTITQMAAASGGTQADDFIPTATQWVSLVVPSSNLSALANRNGVRIRFLFVKDINKTTANNMYIDQINVSGTVTGNAERISGQLFSVYPNPSEGHFLVKTHGEPILSARLFNGKGQELKGHLAKPENGALVVNETRSLDKGIYTLMLDCGGKVSPQKLVVY